MDQYLRVNSSYERLKSEYDKYGSIVVAFDFDNTVYDFHKEGHTYDDVIQLLRNLKSIGCYLICFTASEDENFIHDYMVDNNIPFDCINDNPPFFKSDSKKIYYNVLLDDRAGLIQTYWELTKLYNGCNKSNGWL